MNLVYIRRHKAGDVLHLSQGVKGMKVKFIFEDGNVVTTDGHRLAKYECSDLKLSRAYILTNKSLAVACNALRSTVTIEFTEHYVHLSDGANNIWARLIDEQFPNYQAVIPTENANNFTVDRKALMQAVKEVITCADKDTRQVRFQLSKDKLILLADDADNGRSAKREMAVKHTVSSCAYHDSLLNLLIGFNGKFIFECLKSFSSEEVTFSLSTPTRAAIVTAGNVLQLVMPVRLSS